MAAARRARPSRRLVVAGHSLGGAVATLAAAHLRAAAHPCDLYTYGSPRAGNEAFAAFVDAQASGSEYRLTHLDDPVPRLPPIVFGYRHTSPEYWLFAGGADAVALGVAGVRVCYGTANVLCNAGTFGLDADAHLHYFQPTNVCQGPFAWRRDREKEDAGSAEMTDAELEERLNELARLDVEYVRGLEAARA